MNAIVTLARRKDKDAPVIPAMLTGFNDSHYFRQHGLVAYGFVPIEVTEQEGHTVHGANERIPIKTLSRRYRADGGIAPNHGWPVRWIYAARRSWTFNRRGSGSRRR